MSRIICGVDVSKDWLDAYVERSDDRSGAIGRFANDAAGIADLARLCAGHGVELVVMEASGGCERQPFLLLWQLGQPCALANAGSVRNFAKAMGFLEKTDRIDAMVIARFALAKGMAAVAPPSPQSQRLQSLVTRLSQVVSDLTVNKQRRHAVRCDEALASLDTIIICLKREERRLAGEVASLIDDDPLWAALDRALRSVKGVADRTVARLLAQLPELGLISGKAITKLAGVAPIANDSGWRFGARPIRGGRAGPRTILFLIGAIAAKYDPHLASFQRRLQAAGKPKMVIRIALARKLLVILNAKARDARNEFANAT